MNKKMGKKKEPFGGPFLIKEEGVAWVQKRESFDGLPLITLCVYF